MASEAAAAVVPFGEGANVRYTTIDGRPYLSVRDIIMVVSGKDNNTACQTWRRDVTDEQRNELTAFIKEFKFPGALFTEIIKTFSLKRLEVTS